MKILIASNPFKGSMNSTVAAEAIARGFRKVYPRASFDISPIADGGDGTLDAVAASVPSETVTMEIPGPLSRETQASYLLVDGGATAVIEMANSSGLVLLKASERNPMKATTYGTGLLIADALARGVRKVMVGIGGSATNDGGTGIAAALGYVFLDAKGQPVRPCGGQLARISRIDASKVNPLLAGTSFLVASDVTNPLLGDQGAAAVYSPQKGASPQQVTQLEAGLARLAEIVSRDLRKDFSKKPGAGAAGGTGYGLMTFAGAKLRPGFEIMAELSGLEKRIAKASLVITGEGRIDCQSVKGKAPFGVLGLARKYGKPVVVFAGGIQDEDALIKAGFAAIVPIVDRPATLDEAMSRGPEFIELSATRAARLMRAGHVI